MLHDNTACAQGHLCHKWRICPRCAAIRQARLADLAERRTIAPALTWACLDYDPETKKKVLRSAALIGTGGIWTIEQGELATGRGLHLNLLIDPAAQPEITAGRIARSAAGAEVWAQPVPRCDVRNVIAYINKRRQMPHTDRFAGRIMGTWGHWRGVAEILATDSVHTPATVQAVAIQTGLQRAGVLEKSPQFVPFFNGQKPPEPRLTAEEYREKAERHLAPLLAILGRGA